MAQKPIPDDYLTIGRFCVALFQEQWHRARIIDVFEISVKVTRVHCIFLLKLLIFEIRVFC